MLANGTGARQFATRMALYATANDWRSALVVPATPNGEVREGAPAVVPVIAVAHAGVLGAGLVDPNGAG